MKYACIVAAIASIVGAHSCHAQEAVDKAKAAAFDSQMFAGPLGQKTYPASCAVMTAAIWRSIRSRKSAR